MSMINYFHKTIAIRQRALSVRAFRTVPRASISLEPIAAPQTLQAPGAQSVYYSARSRKTFSEKQ